MLIMVAKMLGQRIKIARTARKINQVTLAKRVGVTQPYIVALEKGRENPTLRTLARLAKALKVPFAELLE
jgi:transcriptional regulator with XRE-family HTH domain